MAASPPLWVLLEVRRRLRFDRAVLLAILGLTAVCGAFSLYLAIDEWLSGHPAWSAANTGIAFINSITFDTNMRHLAAVRRISGRVRTMINQTKEER